MAVLRIKFRAVEKKKRIEVYKKALYLIKNSIYDYYMTSHGLCLLLPCILWELKTYCDESPDGKDWKISNTGQLFPELNDDVIDSLNSLSGDEEKNPLRIKYLEEWISNK
jgi:hypothetical protein